MFILIASSCSEDNDAMDAAVLAQENNSEIAAKGAKVSATAITEAFTMPDVICAGEEFEFCLNFAPEFNSKGKPQKTNLQVQLLVAGDDPDTEETETEYFQQIFQGDYTPNEGDTGLAKVCFDYTFTTAGDYTLRYKIGDGGFLPSSNGMTVTVDNCGCIYDGNAFTGAAVSCGTSRVAEYTFSSEDGVGNFKMQGGLTNFTGTNATVYVNGELVVFSGTSSDGWAQGITTNGYTVGQRTPSNDNGNGNGSSNRNIRVVGELSECSAVVVRIEWTSSNTGTTMTGGWSVKDGELELAPPVADLVCPI